MFAEPCCACGLINSHTWEVPLRYFFNRTDGKRDPDAEGIELPSLAHARYEAVAFAADTLKDDSFSLWDGGEVRIEVVDSARVPVFTVLISVVDETRKLSVER